MNLFEQVMNGKLEEPKEEIFTESVDETLVTESTFPTDLKYNRTLTRKVFLPQGTKKGYGNLCFLYSGTEKDTLELLKPRDNFIAKRYELMYMCPIYKGKLYGKRFVRKEYDARKDFYDKVKKDYNLTGKRVAPANENIAKNMYYRMDIFLDIFQTYCGALQPVKKVQLYWDYMSKIFNDETLAQYKTKFVLVDASKYSIQQKTLVERLDNPLYMIYYTLYRFPDIAKNINMEFYFFNKGKVLIINPSKCPDKCFNELLSQIRILEGKPVKAIDEEKAVDELKKVEAKENVAMGMIEHFTGSSEVVKHQGEDIDVDDADDKEAEEIKDAVATAVEHAAKTLEDIDTRDISPEEMEDYIEDKVSEELDQDEATLSKIYNQTVARTQPKSAASSARDKKLKEDQYKLKIKNMTVKDIENINTSKVKIPVKNISSSIKTGNPHVADIKFDNFNKTYVETVMDKDITNAILALNDKSIPLFIRDVKVEDTSDELNYKDTYTFSMEDANRKRQTIKVDVPKFIDGKFMYLGGNKKLIRNQNFMYPLVKIKEDCVELVTNYNKIFIYRVDNKTTAPISRLHKLLKGEDGTKYFKMGTVYNSNMQYITTVEYDELAKKFVSFKNGKCEILFSQDDALKKATKAGIKIPENRMYIGTDMEGKNLFIDFDDQMTQDDRTIMDVIVQSFPDEMREKYEIAKAPKRLMYAKSKIMSQFIPIVFLLCVWEGLSKILEKANVKFRLEDKVPKTLTPRESMIKFKDCVMVYEENVPVSLLMNGLKMYDLSKYDIAEMDQMEPYIDYFSKVYGKSNIINALMNYYEFMIDPITKEVLNDIHLPDEIVPLIIHGINLLADSAFTPEISQHAYRIRNAEIIPAILYENLAKQYTTYRNSNGRKTLSIPRDVVIKDVLALKTVDDYSTLNPVLEMEMAHAVTTKGHRGANLDQAYTPAKRTMDTTSIGVMGPSTSPDGTVGVSRTLSVEPAVTSIRGYISGNEDLNKLNDVDLFSPAEMSIPLGACYDDPTRLGHAVKQSKHVIPVHHSCPTLISNGFEETVRFHVSSDFVVNADEDGTVIEIDEKTKVMVVEYKSGKHRAVSLEGNIVKNGGGGFYLANVLKTDMKVGQKFKKDDVLAYHKDFFTNNRFSNCKMNMGTIAKCAIMSTYNTYEDATFITKKVSDECSADMTFLQRVVIGKNANVEYLIKEGQEIEVGQPLAQFDTSYDDRELNDLLKSLSNEDAADVLEDSRNNIKSKYSGKIRKIRMYSPIPVDDMSESLRKIFKVYYSKIKSKNALLEKYDDNAKNSIMKCGVLSNEPTKEVEPNAYGVLNGEKVGKESVIIDIFIEHTEPLEVGSKITNITGLKNTVAEIIPEGFEPYSGFRPEEELSTIIASNSILKRMVPSIITVVAGNKAVIELRRTLVKMWNED